MNSRFVLLLSIQVAMATSLLHPDRVSRLVVADISPRAYKHDNKQLNEVFGILQVSRFVPMQPFPFFFNIRNIRSIVSMPLQWISLGFDSTALIS